MYLYKRDEIRSQMKDTNEIEYASYCFFPLSNQILVYSMILLLDRDRKKK